MPRPLPPDAIVLDDAALDALLGAAPPAAPAAPAAPASGKEIRRKNRRKHR